MIDTIKTIILDFQETELSTGTVRNLKIEHVSGKASVCIGVRRSGKSTCLFQIMQRLLDSGVPRRNILYVNFFDDRLHELQHGGIGNVIEAYYALYPEKKNSEMVYCFFDEIQVVAGWESFVDRLMRTEQCEVYITGSSARMLSKEIATQMRGRALSWELFPFSFKEFLDNRNVSVRKPLSTKSRLLVQKCFEEYWESGGFPEVAGVSRLLRTKIHQEYYGAILFRDLVERHDVSHPQAVSDLAHWLIDNIASLYSVNNLTGYLKSRGHKVPKSSVADYLEWFEDAYFLFTVRLFDASLSRSNANTKKIYCIDHALVRSVSSGVLLNSGHLLENLVFTALRTIYSTIYYYRTKSCKEVDFIVPQPDRTKLLVQVCDSLADTQTRKREIGALHEAMVECGATSGIIVTRCEEERIVVDGGEITVIPVWKFLFDLPA
ncbi:MAG: ATP-binding protein [Desulfuromonadaceae bacterium]|nr:ATP-binding protein [Desulfuromonadaceae bacterium]